MANRYDDLERKFGISAYCSSHEGFAAVAKARYSDFIVHEVDRDGNIARLESVETPKPKVAKVEASAEVEANADAGGENSRKRKSVGDLPMPDANRKRSNDSGDEPQKTPNGDWDSRKAEFSKLVGDGPAQDLISFLQKHETEKSNEPADGNVKKFYTLPLISEKQVRRSVHFLIKSPSFSSLARADNHEGRIRIWHRTFEKDMPKDTFSGGGTGGRGGGRNNKNSNRNDNRGKRGGSNSNRTPWPRDRPNFLRFVLYKENIDTTTAAKDVVRTAHLNPKRGIGYAGMKDKRGVTAQFCSAYRVEKEQLFAVNARSGNGNDGGGNTTTKGAAVIKLGNFTYSRDEVRLGSLTGNRFEIVLRNVDVMGNTDSVAKKHLIHQKLEAAGEALKTTGFINYFGMQRFGRSHDTHQVGIAILKGDFEAAIGIIMREKSGESPRITEARKRWANRFESIDASKDENAAREAEGKCAREIQRDMGRFMVCENSIVHTLSRQPRNYKRAFGSIAKNMRSMFLHAYQSYLWNKVASHRIETGGSTEVRVGDLVLIEDKSYGKGGGGTSGLKGKSAKLLDEQDVKEGKYSITDVVLPLAGSRILYPGGSSGDLFDGLLKEDGITKESFGKVGAFDREIALGGDYRKLVCKPSDVTWECLEYKDPVQPLLQTDLMRVNGMDISANVLSDNTATTTPDDDTLFGMVIAFSLPPSAYATIALRELTKRPTSSEYQSKLELSGKCERNILGNSS